MRKADKRKFPRLSFNVEVKYEVIVGQSANVRKSRSKNISAAGLCMMVLEKVRPGAFLNLEFSLPDADTPIFARGKVVWVEKIAIYSEEPVVSYDCGIAFVDITPGDRKKISRHVMDNLKEHPIRR
jgi:c-di-GMP-binding flagellar brake protein YcgR